MQGVLDPGLLCSLVGSSGSGSRKGSRLVDFVDLYVEYISTAGPSILPQILPHDPELDLIFGCESLHLFQSAAGWSFLEDSYVKLLSASIAEYYKSVRYQFLHIGGVKLTPSLIVHSPGLCDIFITEIFVDRTDFMSQDFCVGWCSYPSTRSPA